MGVRISPLKLPRALPSMDEVRRAALTGIGFTALLFGAAIVGLMCVLLPWVFIVGLTMMILFPLLLWNAPWVGLGLYMAIALLSPDQKLADLVTLVSLGILGLRLL